MTAEAEYPVIGEAGRAEPGRGAGRVEHGDVNAAGTKAEPALMEAVVERSNMQRAYQRVVRNKGAAGVDGLGCRSWGSVEATLADDQGQAAGGQLLSPAGTPSEHSEANGGERSWVYRRCWTGSFSRPCIRC